MLHPFHPAFEDAMYEAADRLVSSLLLPDSDANVEVLEDAMRAYCGVELETEGSRCLMGS